MHQGKMEPNKLTNTASLPSLNLVLPDGNAIMHMPGDPTIAAMRPTLDANCAVPSPSTLVPPSEQLTTCRLPPKSNLFVPPHWHETHTEMFRVVKGYALVRLGNKIAILGPDDAPVTVPPFTIHGFGRADGAGVDQKRVDNAWVEYINRKAHGAASVETVRYGAWRSEDVVLDEWTNPLDGEKEVFFRNIISTYIDLVQPLLKKFAYDGSVFKRTATLLQLVPVVPRLLHLCAFTDNYMVVGGELIGVNGTGGPSMISLTVSHALFAAAKVVGRLLGWKFWRDEYTPVGLQAVCKSMESR